jgi:hypothetical protein
MTELPAHISLLAKVGVDDDGNPAMMITSKPSDSDWVVFYGSDEMMTLTEEETQFRDRVVSILAASASKPAPADKETFTSVEPFQRPVGLLTHIKQSPLNVALGFVLGLAAFGCLMMVGWTA